LRCLAGAYQARVPAIERVVAKVVVERLRPTTVSSAVDVGIPSGQYFDEEMWVSHAECLLLQRYPRCRALEVVDGETAEIGR
jgi:hypothetical protein